jgi:uncharacterized protein (TIGR02246 family)
LRAAKIPGGWGEKIMASRRVSWLMVLVVVGGGWVLSSRELSNPRAASASASTSADLQGIERLHKRDIDATLAHDPKALAELFTEDAVLLEPGSAAVVGKPAILAENQKDQAEHPSAKVVSYKPDIKDLQVVDGWAFEWDYFDASYKESEKAEVKRFRAKALRILRRQPDGSWKFARVMWNVAE